MAEAQHNRLLQTASPPVAAIGAERDAGTAASFGYTSPPVFLSAGGQPPHPAVVRITAPGRGSVSYGSGCLVAVNQQHGLIITNWHVVNEAAGTITVDFPDGFESTASVQKVDRDWDLAALAIWRPRVAPARLAEAAPRPGDLLTIAGYGPGKYRSASGECTQYVAPGERFPFEMVEVAVAARQGDSGGPIFNTQGELAGVLFGEGQGRTSGSYCGRVHWFLESVVGPGGLRPGGEIPPGAEPREMIAQRRPELRGNLPQSKGPRATARTGQAIQALAGLDVSSPSAPQPVALQSTPFQLPIVPIPPDALTGVASTAAAKDAQLAVTNDPPSTAATRFESPDPQPWRPIAVGDERRDNSSREVAAEVASPRMETTEGEAAAVSLPGAAPEPLVATVPTPGASQWGSIVLPSLTSRWDQIQAFLAVLGVLALLLWIVRWLAVSGQESVNEENDEPSKRKAPKKKVA